MGSLIVVLIIGGVVCHAIGSYAERKGQPYWGYFILSAICLPVGLLMALLAKSKSEVVAKNENLVKCPFCAEFIKSEAKICRFCQRDIPQIFLDDDLKAKEEPLVKEFKKDKTTSNEKGGLALENDQNLGTVVSVPKKENYLIKAIALSILVGVSFSALYYFQSPAYKQKQAEAERKAEYDEETHRIQRECDSINEELRRATSEDKYAIGTTPLKDLPLDEQSERLRKMGGSLHNMTDAMERSDICLKALLARNPE